MDENQLQEFDALKQKVAEMGEFIEQLKNGTTPTSDARRITDGIGFIGRDADTTPGGCIIVNSPEGPIKVLIV